MNPFLQSQLLAKKHVGMLEVGKRADAPDPSSGKTRGSRTEEWTGRNLSFENDDIEFPSVSSKWNLREENLLASAAPLFP